MVSPAHGIQPADIARKSRCALAAGVCLVLAGCAAGSANPEPFLNPAVIALGSTGPGEPSDELSSSNQTATRERPLTEQQQRQLQVFSATLLSASADIDPETRRSAAQELLAMNLPDSIQVIDQALQTRTPAVVLAAVTAMQATKPIPALLAPTVAALPNASTSVLEPLSWTLARYGEPAVRQVTALAVDQSAAVESRLGPIRALGAFDSQSAATALMQILNRDDESAEVVAATCESLQRLTGLSHNTDVRQWRLWWTQASGQSPEEWSAFVNQSLSKRAAQLQQDLQRQREMSERIARELFNAYRDLYPTLPVDEQLRRLAILLHDPLPPLREFAVARIGLLLRDSVRIPTELQQKLAERLGDETPTIRIEAAKLLHEMNYESISALVAERLSAEPSPAVVAAYLDVLAKRPSAAAIEPARRWLNDASFGPRAANAIWRALQSETITPTLQAALAEDLRNTLNIKQIPAAVRVLALIGNEDDLARLTALLDGPEPALCAAVAEGLCQRGLREPLIQRASNPDIYPFAVRAIAEGPMELPALRRLIAIMPENGNRQTWIEASVKVCSGLPPHDLLAADDLLLATPNVDASVRLALLDRGSMLPREQLNNDDRAKLAARYAPLLIERGEAARAHALLESMGCNDQRLTELCFEAAALSGNYDKASQVHETAAAWVTLLVDVARRDLFQAEPLLNEITRRFEGRLDVREKEHVDRIARLVQEAGAAASANPSNPVLPQ